MQEEIRISFSNTSEDCYLIYIDKLGTSAQISRKFPERLRGLHELTPFYVLSHDIFKSHFNNEHYFFGFSDTVISMPLTYDANIIGVAASNVFFELLKYGIYVKIYICRGNFSFHEITHLNEPQNVQVCPIYGSALLDAYRMDKVGYKVLGVFVERSILIHFCLLKSAIFPKKYEAGFLNLKHYLSQISKDEIVEFVSNNIINKENFLNRIKNDLTETEDDYAAGVSEDSLTLIPYLKCLKALLSGNKTMIKIT